MLVLKGHGCGVMMKFCNRAPGGVRWYWFHWDIWMSMSYKGWPEVTCMMSIPLLIDSCYSPC